MTMTDDEKAQARATDPRAAQIIDRCDAMSPDAMARLHGVLRDPHAPEIAGLGPGDSRRESTGGTRWPTTRFGPKSTRCWSTGSGSRGVARFGYGRARNADAQDIFVAGKTARVTSVHEDVEGNKHVGVVVDDDPAADLHDWYGRYLYFSPDEVEPLQAEHNAAHPERSSTWKS